MEPPATGGTGLPEPDRTGSISPLGLVTKHSKYDHAIVGVVVAVVNFRL